nr:reverse transcriptase domain-containing protein [Tanacetum cinerariifolium]
MDWLRRCHVVIVCDEKLVRVPYRNETLIFREDESNDGKESRLTIISCSKAQEYMAKGLAPPSPDYISGPEEPHTPPAPQDEDEHELMFIQSHDPDYVPDPKYPEYIPLEDEHVLLAEEHAGRVDEDEEEEDEEEEEEHLAPADSAVVIPTYELVSPPEGTEPVIHHPPLTLLPLELGLLSDFRLPYPFHQRQSPLDAEVKRQGIREVGYAITDTWIDPTETVPEIVLMIMGEVKTRVTELAELHEHDTQDLYSLLEDAKDIRTRISQRVAVDSQRVELLMKDLIAHQETIHIIEDEAYAMREAWAHSIGLSQAVHFELHTYQEHMRQAEMAETLRVMGDMRREMGDMQAELLALCEQPRRAGQPGGDARVLNHLDAPRDTDIHI